MQARVLACAAAVGGALLAVPAVAAPVVLDDGLLDRIVAGDIKAQIVRVADAKVVYENTFKVDTQGLKNVVFEIPLGQAFVLKVQTVP